MPISLLFEVVTYVFMGLWLLLALAPRWVGTQLIVHSILVPVALGLVYGWYYVVGNFLASPSDAMAAAGMMESVSRSFSNEAVLLAAWIHFLVFDLFVGAWIVRDAASRGITHWFLLPSLFLTFFAGPIGLVSYLGLMIVLRKGRWRLDEAGS
jgi:hypothetical protein